MDIRKGSDAASLLRHFTTTWACGLTSRLDRELAARCAGAPMDSNEKDAELHSTTVDSDNSSRDSMETETGCEEATLNSFHPYVPVHIGTCNPVAAHAAHAGGRPTARRGNMMLV